jgi:mono/diheme cytochrome c family protein
MGKIRKEHSTSYRSGSDRVKGRLGIVAVMLVAAGLVLVAVLAACGGSTEEPTQAPPPDTAVPEQEPAQDGEALLEARCSGCHSADRARQVTKTRDGWDQSVSRMIDKGAQLTEEEKAFLVDYLTDTYGP